MSRLYYFNDQKKEVGYASYFSDFLSDKKDLAHLNDLTDFDKLFFVEDVCNILIFKSKKALLKCLKEKLENAQILEEEYKSFIKEIKNFKIMSRFYSFSLENKEVDYASDLKDFLPNKKALLNHYNDLPTEFCKLFFVIDVCNLSIFRTKREILIALKEKFDNSEITAEEFKRFKKEIKDFKR